MMTDATSQTGASTLWIMLLTLTGLGVTALLACATPFTALAALAATRMRRRDAVALMLVTWAASQALTFAVHHYPADRDTMGWAAALGLAAVAATLVARRVSIVVPGGEVMRLVAAYLAAMVAFKAVILIGASVLSDGAAAFAPAVLAREALRNGAILIGLYALYHALVAIGVPAPARERLAAA